MAISKRLRYEILRRDGNSCRYCGNTAADSPLTIDHVIPVALGGTDEPSNLVAACRDCNAGKSASAPDAESVQQVSDDAIRWAAAMRQAAEDERALHAEQAEAMERVRLAWRPRYMPTGWESSVNAFLAAGLDIEDILELVSVARSARGVDDRWRYFCGCCWKRVNRMQERASELIRGEQVENAPDVRDLADQLGNAAWVSEYWMRIAGEWNRWAGWPLPECLCGLSGYCGDYHCRLLVCGYALGVHCGDLDQAAAFLCEPREASADAS